MPMCVLGNSFFYQDTIPPLILLQSFYKPKIHYLDSQIVSEFMGFQDHQWNLVWNHEKFLIFLFFCRVDKNANRPKHSKSF
jgi:hypothetical protein